MKMVSYFAYPICASQLFVLCLVLCLGAGVDPDQRPGSSKGQAARKVPRFPPMPRRESPRTVRSDEIVFVAAGPSTSIVPVPVITTTGKIANR